MSIVNMVRPRFKEVYSGSELGSRRAIVTRASGGALTQILDPQRKTAKCAWKSVFKINADSKTSSVLAANGIMSMKTL